MQRQIEFLDVRIEVLEDILLFLETFPNADTNHVVEYCSDSIKSAKNVIARLEELMAHSDKEHV